jgi:succinate dehydrogenase / fumarate reductase, flavoprotein subunit
VSCIYGGGIAGPNAVNYARGLQGASGNGHFDAEKKKQESNNALLMKNEGNENPVKLWRELGELMTKDCTVIRYNKNLQQTDAKLVEFLERYRRINLSDRTLWANTTVVFARQLYNMLQLARVIAQGARMRDESRGAHYKPGFPDRDDKNWLKTTKAYFAPDADEPKFEFEAVDVSLIPPRARKY